ncbi:hypothetical protein [Anaerotignum lactatifermentans]|uniref:hypothetical protein n=1 Tax=Anaerotignum lactatifermentans TaxID=160404 RepID=UPI0026740C1D|nr:hypothetical protein [Anaerotignum lactatifermentans]
MEYKEGYVAFIDILGFSAYVMDENNFQTTKELFAFVKKFCDIFNENKKIDIDVSFFSDSIVLTSNDMQKILINITLLEKHLNKNLGLLFRGGISYGKYYHSNGVTFGPAVVSAYNLENKAKYARIIIDSNISIPNQDIINFYKDIDGELCINPYFHMFPPYFMEGEKGFIIPPNEYLDVLLPKFVLTQREELLNQIKKYNKSSVVEKYLWRVKPFNLFCIYISNLSDNENLCMWGQNMKLNRDIKDKIAKLRISEEELFKIQY